MSLLVFLTLHDFENHPMKPKHKVLLCVFLSIIIVVLIAVPVFVFQSDSTYFRILWNDRLMIISIHIDKWWKYVGALSLVGVISILQTVVEYMANPIIYQAVFNPDNIEIHGFTKRELVWLAVSLFFFTGLRSIVLTLLQVSQIDIALSVVFVSTGTFFVMVHVSLAPKTFKDDPPPADENDFSKGLSMMEVDVSEEKDLIYGIDEENPLENSLK